MDTQQRNYHELLTNQQAGSSHYIPNDDGHIYETPSWGRHAERIGKQQHQQRLDLETVDVNLQAKRRHDQEKKDAKLQRKQLPHHQNAEHVDAQEKQRLVQLKRIRDDAVDRQPGVKNSQGWTPEEIYQVKETQYWMDIKKQRRIANGIEDTDDEGKTGKKNKGRKEKKNKDCLVQ